MSKYDLVYLGQKATELGFVCDTLEKVYRLAEILEYINTEPLSRNTVHLDHSKRLMPITEYGSCRSPNTVHPDHQLPLNPITFGGGIL